MADDRVRDAAGQLGNRVAHMSKETKTGAENLMGQAAGAVEQAYTATVDAAVEGAQGAKAAAVAGHDFLKRFMEENPHTTTMLALGLGLLIGYAAHRPPPRRHWWE